MPETSSNEYSHDREQNWRGWNKRANHGREWGEIEKGVDSRNSMPMGKSVVGNQNTQLGAIPEQDQEAMASSSNAWAAQNYSEKECIEWDAKNRQFYQECENKNWRYAANIDYTENGFGGF